MFYNVSIVTIAKQIYKRKHFSTECLHSVFRGHHIYKCIWTPSVVEKLPVVNEVRNLHYKYASLIYKM